VIPVTFDSSAVTSTAGDEKNVVSLEKEVNQLAAQVLGMFDFKKNEENVQQIALRLNDPDFFISFLKNHDVTPDFQNILGQIFKCFPTIPWLIWQQYIEGLVWEQCIQDPTNVDTGKLPYNMLYILKSFSSSELEQVSHCVDIISGCMNVLCPITWSTKKDIIRMLVELEQNGKGKEAEKAKQLLLNVQSTKERLYGMYLKVIHVLTTVLFFLYKCIKTKPVKVDRLAV